ncbi:hypothetical protein KIPB_002209 [Kipferlia bialata]|uniref:Uncharacterized protein n=1 Tax=Kipferlia bialata TaxID=797122 RepID=A0A9K3CS33_9EUKA|nr:hypothetical protein KIPB_002209 [Kipferlia bialata]|eukprot:g2209.t1
MGPFLSRSTTGRAQRLSIPTEAHTLSGLAASLWDEGFPSLTALLDAMAAESCGEWKKGRVPPWMEGKTHGVIKCSCDRVSLQYERDTSGFRLGEFRHMGDGSVLSSHADFCEHMPRDMIATEQSEKSSNIPLYLLHQEFSSINSLLERMDQVTGGTWDVLQAPIRNVGGE